MNTINTNADDIKLNLITPPASQTETSIALIWEKPKKSSDIAIYHIYINGEMQGSSQSTDYTVTNLSSSQEYEAFICAVLKSGKLSLKSNTIKVTTKLDGELFDITSFGAVGDGKTINLPLVY